MIIRIALGAEPLSLTRGSDVVNALLLAPRQRDEVAAHHLAIYKSRATVDRLRYGVVDKFNIFVEHHMPISKSILLFGPTEGYGWPQQT